MMIIVFAAAMLSSSVSTPVVATDVDPESVLYRLQAEGRWKESRSMWDGHVGRPKARWEWEMKISYGITPTGRMMNCNVIAPSGSAAFDNAACSRLTRESRFEPKRDASGQAVRSSGEVTYQFYHYPAMICITDDEPLE